VFHTSYSDQSISVALRIATLSNMDESAAQTVSPSSFLSPPAELVLLRGPLQGRAVTSECAWALLEEPCECTNESDDVTSKRSNKSSLAQGRLCRQALAAF
jgi:hypothetical protein